MPPAPAQQPMGTRKIWTNLLVAPTHSPSLCATVKKVTGGTWWPNILPPSPRLTRPVLARHGCHLPARYFDRLGKNIQALTKQFFWEQEGKCFKPGLRNYTISIQVIIWKDLASNFSWAYLLSGNLCCRPKPLGSVRTESDVCLNSTLFS